MSASDQSEGRRPSLRRARCHVLLDFDGTIAPDDPTDRLLEEFADPAWRDIEAEWQAGRMSSRDCMERHAALLRATPQELDAAVRRVRVDPSFPAFVHFCRRQRVDVTIVSDGFDRVLRAVLERAQLSLPYFANRLEWAGGDRWRLGFPFAQDDCRSGAGNCKCSHATPRGGSLVVVGDGRSDFCMAVQADYVIAKSALLEFCRERGLPHVSFRTFDEVTAHVAEWLERQERSPMTQLSPVSEGSLGRRS